jgi:hypothetical protein
MKVRDLSTLYNLAKADCDWIQLEREIQMPTLNVSLLD